MNTAITKTCFKCQAVKPLDDFYAHPQMTDGHLNKCKTCAKADTKQNYRARWFQYRRYDRQRNSSPVRRGAKRRYEKLHRSRHPERYRARAAVRNAVRDGHLIKQPCETCATTLNVQAHHEDYSRPLDVRWLCRGCHHKEHGHLKHVEITAAA